MDHCVDIQMKKINNAIEKHNVNLPDANGDTLLKKHILQKNYDHCLLLLENGAKICIKDSAGYNHLHYSQTSNEIVDLLMQKCSEHDINTLTKGTSLSPLHCAVSTGNLFYIKKLLQRDALINIQNIDGDTLLHYAIRYEKHEIIKLLLENSKTDVNQKNKDGMAPLHLVVLYMSKGIEGNEPHLWSEVINLLINRNADLNIQDMEGETPLHLAISMQNIVAARILIEHNADVNVKEKKGRTPLHVVIEKLPIQHAESAENDFMKLLLKKGASPNAKDIDQMTPLYLMVSRYSRKADKWDIQDNINLFLEYQADINQPSNGKTLLECVTLQSKRLNQLQVYLIRNGAKTIRFLNEEYAKDSRNRIQEVTNLIKTMGDETIEAVFESSIQKNGGVCKYSERIQVSQLLGALMMHSYNDKTGDLIKSIAEKYLCFDREVFDDNNILFVAARCGNTSVVNILLQNGWDLEKKDLKGQTPLFVAAQGGYDELVEFLLHHKCNTDNEDLLGNTPLTIAVKGNKIKIVDILLKKGCNRNKKNISGETPLFLASTNGRTEIVRMLSAHDCGINNENYLGITPLNIAVHKQNFDIVTILSRMSCDLNKADNNDVNPLAHAAASGNVEMVKILLENGCNVDIADSNGQTPLFFAAMNGHITVVTILLTNRCNQDRADFYGKTPLFVAVEHNHRTIVNQLLQNGCKIDNHTKHSPLFAARYAKKK